MAVRVVEAGCLRVGHRRGLWRRGMLFVQKLSSAEVLTDSTRVRTRWAGETHPVRCEKAAEATRIDTVLIEADTVVED